MRYSIDDVSLGGAALRGQPTPQRDAPIIVELSIASARSICTNGRVVRLTNGVHGLPGFALAFDDVPPDARQVIEQLSNSLLARAERYRVLVVGAPHPRRDAVQVLVASTGWDVMVASTPLEAIVALQDTRVDIRWVIVVSSLLTIPAADLLRFAADEHPTVRRMVVTREHDTHTAMKCLRGGLSDACLVQPLRRSRVRRALGEGPRTWRA